MSGGETGKRPPEADNAATAIKKPKLEDGSDQQQTVVWEMEDPSEFRKQEELENMGKDVENFRAFYDVSYHIQMFITDCMCMMPSRKT